MWNNQQIKWKKTKVGEFLPPATYQKKSTDVLKLKGKR